MHRDLGHLQIILNIWRQDHVCEGKKHNHVHGDNKTIYGHWVELLSNDVGYTKTKYKEAQNCLDSRRLILPVQDYTWLIEADKENAKKDNLDKERYVLVLEWLDKDGQNHFEALFASNDLDLIKLSEKEHRSVIGDMTAVKDFYYSTFWLEHVYFEDKE